MPARLWTAVLLLTAVFTMHGAQCTSAAHIGGSVSSPAHAAATALGPGHSHVTLAPAVLGALAGAERNVHTGGAETGANADDGAAAAGAAVTAGHGTAPHDAAGNLWTVCLAVLAAGLAALAALLTLRPVRAAPRVLAHVRVLVVVRPTTIRPPDLSALCLWRI